VTHVHSELRRFEIPNDAFPLVCIPLMATTDASEQSSSSRMPRPRDCSPSEIKVGVTKGFPVLSLMRSVHTGHAN